MAKLIAKDEFDIGRVMELLPKEEKIARLKNLYDDDDILRVMGYYDESNPDIADLNDLEENSPEFLNKLYEYAIINGNFEEAIARNCYIPN